MVVLRRTARTVPSDHDGGGGAYDSVCSSVSCRAHKTCPPFAHPPPSVHCPPLARSAADLMHGYQFATPRAILHIGWYWTIHHAARHRHIAHPPLTLQMLLPTSTRCAAAERATREERGRGGESITPSRFARYRKWNASIILGRMRGRRRRGAPLTAFVSSGRRAFNDPNRH